MYLSSICKQLVSVGVPVEYVCWKHVLEFRTRFSLPMS